MKKLVQAGVLVGFALLNSGCPVRGTDEALEFCIVPEKATVNYFELKKMVLEPFGCIRCHSEMETETGVLAKVVAKHPEQSPLFQTVAEGSMPKSGPRLCTGYVNTVATYIKSLGAEPTPTPVPLAPTYVSIRQNILEVSCKGCHGLNGTAPGRRKDLSKFDVFKTNIDDVLERMRLDDTADDVMPPVKAKRPKPTAEMITIIQQWVDAGFPEN